MAMGRRVNAIGSETSPAGEVSRPTAGAARHGSSAGICRSCGRSTFLLSLNPGTLSALERWSCRRESVGSDTKTDATSTAAAA